MHAVNHGLKHTYDDGTYPPIVGYPIYEPGGWAQTQYFGKIKRQPMLALFSDSLNKPGNFEVLGKVAEDKVTIHYK
jgi:hypothetical protein